MTGVQTCALPISNVVREFAFNYAEDNKDRLEKLGFDAFKKSFQVDDAMLGKLVAMGEKEKVKANSKDIAKNKAVFQSYVKAEIARRVWGSQSFYPLFNENNEILQQAVKLFDRIPELNRSKM